MYDLDNICFICLCSGDKNNMKTLQHNLDIKSDVIFTLPELVFRSTTCICTSCYALIRSYYKFKKKCMVNYKRWQQYTKILQRASQVPKYRKLQIRLTNRAPPKKLQQKKQDTNLKFKKASLSTNEPDLSIQINNKQAIKEEFSNNIDQATVTEDEEQIFTITLNINEQETDQKTVTTDIAIKEEISDPTIKTDQKNVTSDTIDLKEEIVSEPGAFCQKTDASDTIDLKEESSITIIKTDEEIVTSDTTDLKEELAGETGAFCQKTDASDAIDLEEELAGESGASCQKTDQQTVEKAVTSDNEEMVVEPDIFIDETDQKTDKEDAQDSEDDSVSGRDFEDIESEESESDSGYKPKPYRKNVRNSMRNNPKYDPFAEFQCMLCKEVLPDRYLYNVHIRLHSKEIEGVECTLCPRKFKDNIRLQRHILFHLCIKDFQCTVCHKLFKDKHILKLHLDLHLPERKLKCYLCTKTFSVNSQLKQHILGVHLKKKKILRKDFKCTVCEKAFIAQKHLDSHMKYHRDERDYSCTICGKEFYTKGRHKFHMKWHLNDNKRECTICYKKLPSHSAAKIHMKYHLNIRDFECEICHKKFVRKRDLNTHILNIHEKNKIVQQPKNDVKSISVQTESNLLVKTEEVCIIDEVKDELEVNNL